MIIAEDDPRLKFVQIADAAVPPGGLIEHIKDSWWAAHPTKGLVFWSVRGHASPQCNKDESITRHLSKMYPWSEVRFVPSAFRRIKLSDYAP